MERAIITISESGCVNIPDGNIWMSFAELVVLFDVAVPTLKTAIQAIHKIGVYRQDFALLPVCGEADADD